MKTDLHQTFRTMIDDALIADPSLPQPPALRLHLQSCEACRRYLDTRSRIITTLGQYSFAVDPSHNSTVVQALRQRAAQLQTRPAHSLDRRQFAWACALAVLFTVAGSLLDIQFGTLLASSLPLHGTLAKEGLLALWLFTSLGALLLFPLLPFLSRPLSSGSPLSPP